MTGIAPCCARAASGHATAAPMSVMNSRLVTKPCDSKGLRCLGALKARIGTISIFRPVSGATPSVRATGAAR